jgi:hypothetical protein
VKVKGARGKIQDFISELRGKKVELGRGGKPIEVDPSVFNGSGVEGKFKDMLTKQSPYGRITDPARFTPEGKALLSFDEIDELTRDASKLAEPKSIASKVGQIEIVPGNPQEGKVAGYLRDSQEASNPQLMGVNEELFKTQKGLENIDNMGGNLGRLITPSTAPGSSSFRASRHLLDTVGGTNFERMSQSIAGARKLAPPTDGKEAFVDMARRLTGKKLINGSSALQEAMSDPTLTPALTSILYGTSNR